MNKFIRLNITAEGQTEVRFVKETLSKHLGNYQISTDVRPVLTSKDKYRKFRGGLFNYQKAKNDIVTWLKEDNNKDARFSTMFDLYALPGNFPGFDEAKKIQDIYVKVNFLEERFKEDIGDYRMIPYIQLHEFEALVLANPQNLKLEYFEHENAINALEKLLKEHDNNPEKINDNRETAPSKRVIKLIPEYDKVNVGATIAGINGIDFLKEKCKHFGEWMQRLENLNT
jgi:hypothetical protein